MSHTGELCSRHRVTAYELKSVLVSDPETFTADPSLRSACIDDYTVLIKLILMVFHPVDGSLGIKADDNDIALTEVLVRELIIYYALHLCHIGGRFRSVPSVYGMSLFVLFIRLGERCSDKS